jgi:Tol biopolymer transport system component
MKVWLSACSCFFVLCALGCGGLGGGSSAGATPHGQIVWSSKRSGNLDIYTMDPDGTHQTQLTSESVNDIEPNWRPDGQKIVYSQFDLASGSRLVTMHRDGGGKTTLPGTANFESDVCPSYSPDGSKILYISDNTPDSIDHVFSMNADGTNRTQLTSGVDNDFLPVYSPDGSKIVYQTAIGGGLYQIFIANADGSNPTQLTFDSGSSARFSPDGTKIVYSSEQGGQQDIYVMNIDGSNKTQITTDPGNDFYPCFSPDGSQIVFSSGRTGDVEIYRMNADGSNEVQLTNTPGVDYFPAWLAE